MKLRKSFLTTALFCWVFITTSHAQTPAGEGDFWTALPGPVGGSVNCATYDSLGRLLIGTNSGVFYRDGGNLKWKPSAQTGLESQKILSLAVTDDNQILAGTENGVYLAGTGESWENKTGNLSPQPINALAYLKRPTTAQWWAGTAFSGLYRSVDEGASFQPAAGLNDTFKLKNIRVLTTAADGTLLAAADSAGVFFFNPDSSLESAWKRSVKGLENRKIWAILPIAPDTIFLATDKGVYQLTDTLAEDAEWTKIEGEGFDDVARGIARRNDGALVVAGAKGNIYVSNLALTNWNKYPIFPIFYPFSCLLKAKDDTFFAGAQTFGVYRSVNGTDWDEANQGLIGSDVATVATAGDSIIFAGIEGLGVLKSSDNGKNWQKMNDGLSSYNVAHLLTLSENAVLAATIGGAKTYFYEGSFWRAPEVGHEINALGVNRLFTRDKQKIYAGTFGNGVWRSNDKGKNWNPIDTTGLTNLNVRALTYFKDTLFVGTAAKGVFYLNPTETKWTALPTENAPAQITAFAVVGDTLFAATPNGAYYYFKHKWKFAFEASGPAAPLTDLVANVGGHLFAATDGAGVWFSTDAGQTWNTKNDGLTDDAVNCLAFQRNQALIAGTRRRGLFQSERTIIVSRTPLQKAPLARVRLYPNPTTDALELRFLTPSISAEIAISDRQGRRLESWIQTEAAKTISVQDFPQGLYFLEIREKSGEKYAVSFMVVK